MQVALLKLVDHAITLCNVSYCLTTVQLLKDNVDVVDDTYKAMITASEA